MIHTVPAGLPPLDPPPLTVETMLFSWTFDSVVLVPLALTGVLYLWGVRRLRRRGDAWAPRRTAFFLLGLDGCGLGRERKCGARGHDR